MAVCGRLLVPIGSIRFLGSRCWFINPFQCISMKAQKAMEESMLPQKPKKPLTPFFKYLKIMRPQIISEFPELKTIEVVKKISERWSIENAEYKLKLHQDYDTEYKEYMKSIIEYEKSLTTEQRINIMAIEDKLQAEIEKTKRKRSLKQLGKPKKPPSTFLLYLNEQVKGKKDNTTMQEFIKNVSLQWKNLTEQDKKPYQTQATELMKQYIKEKVEWEQKMIQEDIYKAKETHGKITHDMFLQV